MANSQQGTIPTNDTDVDGVAGSAPIAKYPANGVASSRALGSKRRLKHRLLPRDDGIDTPGQDAAE